MVDPVAKARYERWKVTPSGRYSIRKNTAKQRGIAWKLTEQQVEELLSLPCYYCGETGGGIDRADPSVGYLIDNCFPCCTACNYMKNTLTVAQFRDRVERIYCKWLN